MPPVMRGREGWKEEESRERKAIEKKERASGERSEKRNGETEAEGEKGRGRRWMLINYKPSGSKSSSFTCGVGAAESHGGSY